MRLIKYQLCPVYFILNFIFATSICFAEAVSWNDGVQEVCKKVLKIVGASSHKEFPSALKSRLSSGTSPGTAQLLLQAAPLIESSFTTEARQLYHAQFPDSGVRPRLLHVDGKRPAIIYHHPFLSSATDEGFEDAYKKATGEDYEMPPESWKRNIGRTVWGAVPDIQLPEFRITQPGSMQAQSNRPFLLQDLHTATTLRLAHALDDPQGLFYKAVRAAYKSSGEGDEYSLSLILRARDYKGQLVVMRSETYTEPFSVQQDSDQAPDPESALRHRIDKKMMEIQGLPLPDSDLRYARRVKEEVREFENQAIEKGLEVIDVTIFAANYSSGTSFGPGPFLDLGWGDDHRAIAQELHHVLFREGKPGAAIETFGKYYWMEGNWKADVFHVMDLANSLVSPANFDDLRSLNSGPK